MHYGAMHYGAMHYAPCSTRLTWCLTWCLTCLARVVRVLLAAIQINHRAA